MKQSIGKSIPPLKEHVVIYFLQKGCSENLALDFFRHFDERKWRNLQGDSLSNWKVNAWDWILKRYILK